MPIGMAPGVGRDDAGVATWRLTMHKVELPGRWIVVDREFRSARDPGPGSSR